MVDLNGEYRHKVDAKGRLSLPAKFRKVLQGDLVVTLSPSSDCLYVFQEEDFNNWVQDFFEQDGGFNPRNKDHVNLRRVLKARAFGADIDGSGRINIPAGQRADAGIDKDVALVGNTGYFEIWDASSWDEQNASIDVAALYFN